MRDPSGSPFSLLLAQVAPVPRRPADNAARAASLVRSNASARLAIFPELFLSGYQLVHLEGVSVDPQGSELGCVREAAADTSTAVLIGFAERTGNGRIGNSVACIDEDGSLMAVYRKVHLFGAERDVFEPGEAAVVVGLCGELIGVSVCFDVEFPEFVRALARAGATMLATLSANMDPHFLNHEIHARARAIENGLRHVYVNRPGEESGFVFVGGSRVLDSAGETVAQMSRTEEQAVVVPLPRQVSQDGLLEYDAQLRSVPVHLHRGGPVSQ